MPSTLDAALDAVRLGRWREALDVLDADPASSTDPVALEVRAQASYGAGEFEAAVAAWEALHAVERERGDEVAAARAAAMVATFLLIDTGLMAAVRGWLRRADRLLEGHGETPAHALVAMTRGYERLFCGDLEAARTHLGAAVEVGSRTGTAPAVLIGRVGAARVEIFDGDLERGVDELHEVATLLTSGAVDPLTAGMAYCELICAAQGAGMHDLASEWTDLMERWRDEAAFGGLGGRCRVHRAELLRISGPCDRAEAEAIGACDELRPWMRREYGWPLVELGNIRLRRGDLAGAEAAFLEAHHHAWSPQPGLALLRLAQGDGAGAKALIDDAIEHPFDLPWKERPPIGDLRLAPLLDAQSQIAHDLGDPGTARRAAERLAGLAERYAGRFLAAWAALARARALLLEGDADAAITAAGDAVAAWSDLGAPFEAASARLVLAAAYDAAGSREAAALEWDAAERAFREFGARRQAEVVRRRRSEGRDRPAGSPDVGDDRRVRFTTDGRTRTIVFRGVTAEIADLKGLRYVTRLVAEPGREFHVLDLVAVEAGVLRDERHRPGVDEAPPAGADAGLPVLDDAARAAYRRRLADIDDDIDDARRMNDPARLALAEQDREYLVAELTRAVGLGGRTRTTGGSSERARTSVARSIRYGLERLAAVHEDLGARLARTIHTGTYCRYEPDPVAPLRWQLVEDPTQPASAPK